LGTIYLHGTIILRPRIIFVVVYILLLYGMGINGYWKVRPGVHFSVLEAVPEPISVRGVQDPVPL
jgi:hypothetical protein